MFASLQMYINSTRYYRRNRCIKRKWFSRVHTSSIEKLGIRPTALAFQFSSLFRLKLLLDWFKNIFVFPT